MRRIVLNRIVAFAAVCGALLFGGCGSERRPTFGQNTQAARERLLHEGVPLSIDPAGAAGPVTCGVPLPEGAVKDAGELRLLDADNNPVPCQFTPLCRWPPRDRNDGMVERWNNGSVKWVLLDFFADATASNTAGYALRMCAGNPAPSNVVGVVRQTGGTPSIRSGGTPQAAALREESGITLDNGSMCVTIETNLPGLIHSVIVNGMECVTPTNPAQAVLVNGDGKVYRGSKPKRVTVEASGPIRATVLVQGEFLAEDGSSLLGGKAKYDARITVDAGKPEARIAFTLKNHGEYYGKNKQWLYFKSLRFDVPLREYGGGPEVRTALLGGKEFRLEPGQSCSAAQWYKYPFKNARDQRKGRFEDETAIEDACGMAEQYQGFYWRGVGIQRSVGVWEDGGMGVQGEEERKSCGAPGKLGGWAEVRGENGVRTGMAVRRFWQNFPCGFAAEPKTLSFLVLPDGGFWPRSEAAHEDRTYQFEGGRHKTWEFVIRFCGERDATSARARDSGPSGRLAQRSDAAVSAGKTTDAMGPEMERSLNDPLFARAPVEWYRDTGAVWPVSAPVDPLPGRGTPLAPGQIKADDAGLREAMERYDRLQRAKVKLECGDTAGPQFGFRRDCWGKVSIPDLQERCADIFGGWMNYGDLIWGFGYCSLYYEWPYAMLQQYLRLGDREFLDLAEDMVRHRYDIDQWHHGEGRGGWQRYEKSEHGDNNEVEPGVRKWADSGHPSHTWNRGLLLCWALRGDKRALDAAVANGQAYYDFFYGGRKLAEKEKLEYAEFRTPVWAMENWMALHEYTGEKKYLDWSNEIFDKTLLAMERDNGSCGHILKKGHQDGQFTSYMVEPVCRLHHLTGRQDALRFLRRALDWQRERGTLRGIEKDGKYYPTLWRDDWDVEPGIGDNITLEATTHYSILFCDGYAYLGETMGRQRDKEFAAKLFREFVFYYDHRLAQGCARVSRTPLGYHYLGDALDAAKLHAFSGRYGQIFLQCHGREPQ